MVEGKDKKMLKEQFDRFTERYSGLKKIVLFALFGFILFLLSLGLLLALMLSDLPNNI